MAEIKTMEHYIVARLQELEEKVEAQRAEIDKLCTDIAKRDEIIRSVAKGLKVEETYDHEGHYIDFDTIWEKYEKERFDWYVNAFNLYVPKNDEVSEEGE